MLCLSYQYVNTTTDARQRRNTWPIMAEHLATRHASNWGPLSYLHSLRWRVVVVVVRLVVLVPVVTRLDTVEVARFSGAELVVPPVRLTDT